MPLGAAAFGGAERSLLELAASQQALGLRVLVCQEPALEGTGFTQHAAALGLRVRRVEWSPSDSALRIALSAARFLRRCDASVIHFNISWRSGMWLLPLMATMLSAASRIGTMRAMPERVAIVSRRATPHLRWLPKVSTWALRNRLVDFAVGKTWAATLHHTVAVNANDYPPRLEAEFGFPAKRLSTIYNGVRLPDAPATPGQRAAAKQALGFPADVVLVACVGRVSVEKGIGFALDALHHCNPAVHLVVAGEGPETDNLKARAAALGLAGRVCFAGHVQQPFDVFFAADIAVVPSLWNEAFGRVVVEAMACGAVVIATEVGGMREIFAHGEEGFFVPKADAAAITAAVELLSSQPLLRQRMSDAGRQLVERRYALARVAADYAALYERFLR